MLDPFNEEELCLLLRWERGSKVAERKVWRVWEASALFRTVQPRTTRGLLEQKNKFKEVVPTSLVRFLNSDRHIRKEAATATPAITLVPTCMSCSSIKSIRTSKKITHVITRIKFAGNGNEFGRGLSCLNLGSLLLEIGRAISRPFAIAIRAARLYTAWLRYRFYVVVDLKSSIPAIPECLLSSARSFTRSKQDEVALLRRQGSFHTWLTSSCSTRPYLFSKGAHTRCLLNELTKRSGSEAFHLVASPLFPHPTLSFPLKLPRFGWFGGLIDWIPENHNLS